MRYLAKIHSWQLMVALLLSLTVTMTKQQQSSIQQLNISQSYNQIQQASTYLYYQVEFIANKKMLSITIDADQKSKTIIFSSLHVSGSNQTYHQYPNKTQKIRQCDQNGLDSCIIRLDNPSQGLINNNVSLYFSVYASSNITYDILVSLDDIVDINIQDKRTIYFLNFQDTVLRLSGRQTDQSEEVVMIVTYDKTAEMGTFNVLAAVNGIPNSGDNKLITQKGITIGALNKIIKLKPIPVNSSYYLLIESQIGTKLTVRFYNSTPSAPDLKMNQSVIYQTSKNMTYNVASTFQNIDSPIYIKLNGYCGYGVFTIDYCYGLFETTFQNVNGENGEVGITSDQRYACMESIIDNIDQQLTIQAITINISNAVNFGYQIGVNEGIYNFLLTINLQQFGVLLVGEDFRYYPLQTFLFNNKSNQHLQIQYNQLTSIQNQFLLFQLMQSYDGSIPNSTTISKSLQTNKTGRFPVPNKPNCFYILKVSNPSVYNNQNNQTLSKLQYTIMLIDNSQTSQDIVPGKVYHEEIEQYEYQFYEINFTKIKEENGIKILDQTKISIHVKDINGRVTLLSSLLIHQPTIMDMSKNKSDVKLVMNGQLTYIINQTTKIIYLSINGNEQSLYSLHITMDINQNIPIRYTKLLDGTQSNFVLTADKPYALLTYSSHIIPYTIAITGNPSCIKYGTTLPLDQTCFTNLPPSFTNKVLYFNISNPNINNYKFSVYINSGIYILNGNNPVMITCLGPCFELITVQISQQSNIIHQGRGQIYQVSNSSNLAINSFLSVDCIISDYPCEVKINASLNNGGDMTIYLEQSKISKIDWGTYPFTFGNPKKVIYSLRPWSEINSIIVSTFVGLQLDAYYNIINVNRLQQNVINFDFPSKDSYEGKSNGHPFRRTHIITISNELIESKDCQNPASSCIVTLVLYPNLTIEYDQGYMQKGVGFMSSNSFQYFMPLNIFYQINQKFSLNYFTHKRNGSEVNYTNNVYRINLKPLSDCHPKIYTGAYSSNSNFQNPYYNDTLIQYQDDWINFTIMTEGPCRYRVALSNSQYQFVSQNILYKKASQNGELVMIYLSEHTKTSGFTIEVQYIPTTSNQGNISPVNYILVNELSDPNSPTPPTQKQAKYMASNKTKLTIPQKTEGKMYIIKFVTNLPSIDFLIRKDQPTVLLHNQFQSQILLAHDISTYQFYITGPSVIIAIPSEGSISAMVTAGKNKTQIFKGDLTQQKNQLMLKQQSFELVTYNITLQNQQQNSIQIFVYLQELSSVNYKALSPGIIVYDVFLYQDEPNCYLFSTTLQVESSIQIDFVISSHHYNNSYKQDFDLDGYAYLASGKEIAFNISTVESIPYANKIVLQFVPEDFYTVCLTTANMSGLNKEYYLILNDPNKQHLIQGSKITVSKQRQYDMYQIIEQTNSNIMIEVTPCIPSAKNDRALVGTSLFNNYQQSKFTNLLTKYQDSMTARLTLSEGYYYLGVKNIINKNNLLNSYTIRYLNILQNSTFLMTYWRLESKQIHKIYRNKSSQGISIEVPELVSLDGLAEQNNITITYSILILNTTIKNNLPPLVMMNRCPNYEWTNIHSGKTAIQSDLVTSYAKMYFFYNIHDYIKNRQRPIFQIMEQNLPDEFNMTGKVQIDTNMQQFTYYYDLTKGDMPTELTSDPTQSEGVSSLFIVTVLITVLVMLGLGAYFLWRRHKLRKQRTKVAFEIANFNHAEGSPDSTARKDQRQTLITTSSAPKPTSKDIEKGYGEFVDEVQ